MESVSVPRPHVEIILNGQNVTKDVSPYLISVTYTDQAHTISDELEFVFEDRNDLFKTTYLPALTGQASAKIGYFGTTLMDCGQFQIEEVQFNGGDGDLITIRAVSALVVPTLRTKSSAGYEDKTLKQIVDEVASRHGLEVKGTFEDFKIDRSTQNHEKDLSFLERLAKEYGYAFNVKGKIMTFYRMLDLENSPAGLILPRNKLKSFDLKFNVIDSYEEAEVSYHKPSAKKSVKSKVANSDIGYTDAYTNKDGLSHNPLTTNAKDKLKLHLRSKDEQTAKVRATAQLNLKNRNQVEGTVVIVGNPSFLAGVNVELTGLGGLGGPYFMDTVAHKVSRSGGYDTTLTLRRPASLPKAAATSNNAVKAKQDAIKSAPTPLKPDPNTPESTPTGIDLKIEGLGDFGVVPYTSGTGETFQMIK